MGFGRKRILVVEDDVGQRGAISSVIGYFIEQTDVDIDVEEEGTAHDAYVRVAQGTHDQWLIVTDYQMPPANGHPIRDGMDLVRGIRGQLPDVQARIVFMTGATVPKETVAALGADRFLEKPFVFPVIIEELLSFLASD